MPFREWFDRFTSLFSAVNFPSSWKGQRCRGSWTGDVGGNRQMSTWLSNPKFKIRLNSKGKSGVKIGNSGDLREVFIGIYIRDSRMTMGFDYFKDPLYATPLAFDVVTEEELKFTDPEKRKTVDRASYPPYRNAESETVKQPPYNFGTTQAELMLRLDEDYYIVPSLYKRNQPGNYFISVFADVDDFFLEGGVVVSSEHAPMQLGSKSEAAVLNENSADVSVKSSSILKELKMSVGQFYEKKESLRERFTLESKRLNINMQSISSIFSGGNALPVSTFKRRMVDLGFNLADFPDDDLLVLDEDNSGSISREELLSFLKTGITLMDGSDMPEPPPPPIDDMLFKAADMEGIFEIEIVSGRQIRDGKSVSSGEEVEPTANLGGRRNRQLFKYDPIAAEARIKECSVSATSIRLASENEEISAKAEFYNDAVGKLSLTKESTRHDDDWKSVTSRNTAGLVEAKSGNDAAVRLHSDSVLQKGEVTRTANLQMLRRINPKVNASLNDLDDFGNVLRLKTKPLGSKSKRDILRDRETMTWLSHTPQAGIRNKIPICTNDTSILSEKLSVKKLFGVASGDQDFWDQVITSVIKISASRDKKLSDHTKSFLISLSTNQMSRLSFPPLGAGMPAKSPSNNPSMSSMLAKKGNAPTPRRLRHSSGTVTSIKYEPPGKQRNVDVEQRDKLNRIEEDQFELYEEVYRRLILVPKIDRSGPGSAPNASKYTQSDGANAFIRELFQKFDKNDNGLISISEFQNAMKYLRIDMTADECLTLFNRLDRKTVDSNIDIVEFTNFFNECIKDIELNSFGKVRAMEKIENLLLYIRSLLHPMHIGDMTSSPMMKSDVVLNDLKASSSAVNVEKLKALGVSISILDMTRVSRIFNESVILFHEFMAHPSLDLDTALMWFNSTLFRCLIERSGTGSFTATTTSKLWVALGGSNLGVSFEKICNYFLHMIEDSIHHQEDSATIHQIKHDSNLIVSGHTLQSIGGSIVLSPREVSKSKTNASDASKLFTAKADLNGEKFCSVMGVQVDILCRIVLDAMFTSHWNKVPETLRSSDVNSFSMISNTLSYSGFEAFVRSGHVKSLEDKLHCLLHVSKNETSGAVYLLVHVYFSSNRDEVVILAHDPIIGEVYKLQLKEDVSCFPSQLKLLELLQPKVKKVEDLVKRLGINSDSFYNSRAWTYYNPVDTPLEDQAVTDMLKRLRLVRSGGSPSTITLAEDPSFVLELKGFLDAMANDVPFFVLLNDVNLSFEIDKNSLSQNKTIEKVVFSAVRKNKPLVKFMTNVDSILDVTLSTYNGQKRQIMSWKEMVSYLLDYRNPFVTIQLLPKFLEPDEYFYNPVSSSEPFTGGENEKLATDCIHRGDTDMDGGKFPTWNSKFQLMYKPPKLSSCKILSKETAKLNLQGKQKYVLVMIRQAKKQGKQSFLFLTVYDPRNSTEYQCGLHSQSNLYKTMRDESLSIVLDSNDDGKLAELLLRISTLLENAVTENQIVVGPAITPSLIINVYNQRGRQDELLGSSQVSISSVLSGTGIRKPQWVTLGYTSEKARTVMNAGEVLVDISFRKLTEIVAERKSGLGHLEKIKPKAKDDRTLSTSTITPGPTISNQEVSSTSARTTALTEPLGAKQHEIEQLQVENEKLKKLIESTNKSEFLNSIVEPTQMDRLRHFEETVKQLDESKQKLEKENTQLLKELSIARQLIEKESNSSSENESLQNINRRLQSELDKLRAEYERSQILASGAPKPQPASVKGNVMNPQASLPSESVITQSAIGSYGQFALRKEAFNEDLKKIVDVFVHRHESRILSGTAVFGSEPLDTLERLLQCHSQEYLLNSKQVVNAFADASVDLSLEAAELLLQKAGKPSSKDHVTYQSLITFLKRRIASSVEVSNPGILLSKSTAKGRSLDTQLERPPELKTSTQRGLSKTPNLQGKSESPGRKETMVSTAKNESNSNSKKADIIGRKREESQDLEDQHKAIDKHIVAIEKRMTESVPTLSNVVIESEDGRSGQAGRLDSTQPNLQSSTDVNWDEFPLPTKSWERRLDPRNGKVSCSLGLFFYHFRESNISLQVYYVNHETKTTQWHHPSKKSVRGSTLSIRPESAKISTQAKVARSKQFSSSDIKDDYTEDEVTSPSDVREAWM